MTLKALVSINRKIAGMGNKSSQVLGRSKNAEVGRILSAIKSLSYLLSRYLEEGSTLHTR